jgi:uncharacterized membrane protein (UPF0182 family)
MTRRSWVRVAVVLALGALLAGRWVAVAVTDRVWAESLGVGASHAAIGSLRLALLALAFTAAAVWSLANLYLVYRTIGSVHVPRRLGNLEIVEALPRRYLLIGTVLLGLVIAVIASHGAGDWWPAFALLGSRAPGGLVDPVLHRDLGYYLFRLPWLRIMHGFGSTLSAVMLVVVTGLYGLVGAIRFPRRRLVVADWARTHLGALLAVFALALAGGFLLDPPEYAAGLRNVPYDAVLVAVRLPVARVMAVGALLVALCSLAWTRLDRAALVVVPWAALALLALVGGYVLPTMAAGVRGHDELAVPELATAQRRMLVLAFGLPRADTILASPARPAPELVSRRGAEIGLVALWDPAGITEVLNRAGGGPSYQRFTGAALDLYRGRDGQPTPVYLAAREVDLLAAREADPTMSWASVHAGAYRDAQGAVAALAARAGGGGLPLFLPDLARPDSVSPRLLDLGLASAEQRFSPSAEEYAVVDSGPGREGIAPGGLFRRLALAWTLQTPRLLSTRSVPGSARLLWHRGITGRLDRYAPFARFGSPYPVVAEGRLLWAAWGYVSAEAFPFSVAARWRGSEVRYLRASLLGLVDAQSGATGVYLLADPDPLSAAWAQLLPDVVRPLDRLPRAIHLHLRYPDQLFAVQQSLVVDTPEGPRAPARARPDDRPPPPAAPAPAGWLVGTFPGDDTVRLRLRGVLEQGDPAMLAGVLDGHVEGTRPVLRVARWADPLVQPGPSQFATTSLAGLEPPGGGMGPVTTLVFPQGVIMFRSLFAAPDSQGGPPRLQEVVAGSGGAEGRGAAPAAAARDLATAVQLGAGGRAGWPEARRWFERMDAARRAGDWAAFGRAYQRLRRLLGAGSDSVP